MPLFRRGQTPAALAAAVSGVKAGDRVLYAGPDDTALAAEVAALAGLNGRVVLLAPDDASARTRGAAVEAAGALVEPHGGSLQSFSREPGAFDVAVAEDTLDALAPADRAAALNAAFAALRPGGRLMWIERQSRRLFGPRAAGEAPPREADLSAAGFRGVRTLATAGGRVFVEGVRAAGQ